MRNGQLDNVLRYIRSLLAAGQSRELPDRELLERFVIRQDEAAFTAIVERHGPLVFGVCRRTLRSEHHAEDACQATFLVLARRAGSIRKRQSLGCWLYGVAYRVARKLRADIKRRTARVVTVADVPRPDTTGEITWREGLAVLDEELNRLPATYRSALVLCYLEGRTQDEAARELGCSLGALRGRLERARHALRGRLLRRGVGLPVTLLGTTLAATQASAAVPPTLAIATVKAAVLIAAGKTVAGVVPAPVATLTEGVLKAMLMTKVQGFVILGLLVGMLGLGAAVLTGIAGSPSAPPVSEVAAHDGTAAGGSAQSPLGREGKGAPEEQTARSMVRDTAAKPIAGAHVFWAGGVQPKIREIALPKDQRSDPKVLVLAEGKTDADGRSELRTRFKSGDYPEMLLVATAPGYGVAGKTFSNLKDPLVITLHPEVKIRGQLLTPAGAPAKGVRVQLMSVTFSPQERVGIGFRRTDATFPYWPAAVLTDEQGRFTIDGFSEDADAHLTITHDQFAVEELYVSTKSKVTESLKAFDIQPLKPEFKHTLQPARPVQGVVTAADTGKPLAGVVVEVVAMGSHGGQVFDTRTDAQGRYRVSGHAATASPAFGVYGTTVSPPADSGYLCVSDMHQTGWPAGAKFLEKNFALPRGRLLRGTVLDADTGKPIPGVSIVYQPKQGNPHSRHEYDLRNRVLTDKDGRFTITGLAGQGVLVAEGAYEDYLRVSMPRDETMWNRELFPHGFAPIDVPEKGEPAAVEIKLRKGVTLEARVVGPDGSALPWVNAWCPPLHAIQIDRTNSALHFDNGLFRMPGSDPNQTYRVFFTQPELHLGAVAELKYDSKPAEVRLQPTASVRGKLVNPDGSVPKNYQAYALLQMTKEEGKLARRDFFDQDRFIIYENLTLGFFQTQQNPDGGFLVKDLIPEVRFYIVGATGQLGVRTPVTLKPGEVKDVGTLTLVKEEGL